jgi:hypothetical protein
MGTFREVVDRHISAALASRGELCGMPREEMISAAEDAVHEWLIAEFMDWADFQRGGQHSINGAEAVDILIQKIRPTRPANSNKHQVSSI